MQNKIYFEEPVKKITTFIDISNNFKRSFFLKLKSKNNDLSIKIDLEKNFFCFYCPVFLCLKLKNN